MQERKVKIIPFKNSEIELVKQINRGSYGEVYEAKYEDRIVAVKIANKSSDASR
jgi:serine/threonine protein kinase